MLRTKKRLTALSFGTRQPEDSQKTRLTYSTETRAKTKPSVIHSRSSSPLRSRSVYSNSRAFKPHLLKSPAAANPTPASLTVLNHTRSHPVVTWRLDRRHDGREHGETRAKPNDSIENVPNASLSSHRAHRAVLASNHPDCIHAPTQALART